jgi:flagellar biosynthesis GTPase FlhF
MHVHIDVAQITSGRPTDELREVFAETAKFIAATANLLGMRLVNSGAAVEYDPPLSSLDEMGLAELASLEIKVIPREEEPKSSRAALKQPSPEEASAVRARRAQAQKKREEEQRAAKQRKAERRQAAHLKRVAEQQAKRLKRVTAKAATHAVRVEASRAKAISASKTEVELKKVLFARKQQVAQAYLRESPPEKGDPTRAHYDAWESAVVPAFTRWLDAKAFRLHPVSDEHSLSVGGWSDAEIRLRKLEVACWNQVQAAHQRYLRLRKANPHVDLVQTVMSDVCAQKRINVGVPKQLVPPPVTGVGLSRQSSEGGERRRPRD